MNAEIVLRIWLAAMLVFAGCLAFHERREDDSILFRALTIGATFAMGCIGFIVCTGVAILIFAAGRYIIFGIPMGAPL